MLLFDFIELSRGVEYNEAEKADDERRRTGKKT